MSPRRPRRRTGSAVLLAALAALTTGCGDTDAPGTVGARGAAADSAPAVTEPSAIAADRALTYMRAMVADNWTAACDLMSAAERPACRMDTAPPEPETDGPAIGPVVLDRAPTRVPATSDYPEGWGVITTHTLTWPGKPVLTSYTALRMTKAAGKWWVEQYEDVADSDLVWSDDPARSALSREVR